MKSRKLIISSKQNLVVKYAKGLAKIEQKISALIKADKKLKIDTMLVYIDDTASCKKAGIKAIKTVTAKSCKESIDQLYSKLVPAYIVILGAQDIIPFVEIKNPADDEDATVPSDLPYACHKPYSTNIRDFTGPGRVVGRLPDIAGDNDPQYLITLIDNIIRAKPVDAKKYSNYFAVTCDSWKESTKQTIENIFGNNHKLLISPPAGKSYKSAQLKTMTHFYNCHGASNDFSFYGQKGNSYPQALHTNQLRGKISFGAIVAAECCYGAELVNNLWLGATDQIAIANQYLLQGALAFMGSSTIAYGPVDSQGLADLITQYFVKEVLNGASTGRAMLQARQQFLSQSGPSLDPYELKTLAQFNLIGDPSVLPVLKPETTRAAIKQNTIQNNRINLFNKGIKLEDTIAPSIKMPRVTTSKNDNKIRHLLKSTDFTNPDRKGLYKVQEEQYKAKAMSRSGKALVQTEAKFRTFIKEASAPGDKIKRIRILIVKETDADLLGWKIYVSR